jgi:hypothetical protein
VWRDRAPLSDTRPERDATDDATKEVTMVNTIMTFSTILYIWLGLTVVAAIAGSINHRLSPH